MNQKGYLYAGGPPKDPPGVPLIDCGPGLYWHTYSGTTILVVRDPLSNSPLWVDLCNGVVLHDGANDLVRPFVGEVVLQPLRV